MHTVQEIDNGIGIIPFHAVNWKKKTPALQFLQDHSNISTSDVFFSSYVCMHTHTLTVEVCRYIVTSLINTTASYYFYQKSEIR